MLDFIKEKLKKNQTVYYISKLMRYLDNKGFQDYVRGFRGPDILTIHHLGELYPELLVYDIKTLNYKSIGFWAVINSLLRYFWYAQIYHLTPVVRWTESDFYKEKNLIQGSSNVFEYFFLPVSDVKVTKERP